MIRKGGTRPGGILQRRVLVAGFLELRFRFLVLASRNASSGFNSEAF